ncbi:LruC domain-containing protein [Methylovulum psychrotolerans]|uniref:LruC domain-containing protein n=1 Tax=Methylovulum psychrotolerans TaxID=1704499 RepID=A0A1Z4C0B1_9GAMM|nr:LruC domain-containing protein [Methylovulum psychrotolerans]ASF46965.1 hypothetical protein CEK71_13285 [Methylovulum psychrotolerans]
MAQTSKTSWLKFATLLLAGPFGISSHANAKTDWQYFGPYNKTTGVPNAIFDMSKSLPSDLLSRVLRKLPEGQNINKNSEKLLTDDQGANIFLVRDAEVKVAFVYSGAGYHNGLGFFKFSAENMPTKTTQVQDKILFPSSTSAIYNPSTAFLKYGNALDLGTFHAGDALGFTLLGNGWVPSLGADNPNQSANAIFRTLQKLNPEVNVGTNNYKAHTVLLSNPSDGLLVLGFEDMNRTPGQGSDNDFNDVVIAIHVTPFSAVDTSQLNSLTPKADLNLIDTDKDTVPDYLDAFPNDPTRSAQRFYPSSTGYGKLAFEDQWPLRGDYDMNDVVMNYRIIETLNAAGQVTDVDSIYQVMARGGVYDRGFGLHFPGVASSDIVLKNADGSPAATLMTNNGTPVALVPEANQPEAVLIISPNLKPGTLPSQTFPCSYFNTWSQCPTVQGPRYTAHITFTKPKANLTAPPYNPFIFSAINRGKETHLVDMQPTALADRSLFGTGDDASDPSKGHYYRTANNLPWALDIPDTWQYPLETQDVTTAYGFFGSWAESSGVQNTDWYLHPTNKNYLYIGK